MTVPALVAKTRDGLSERTIRAWESPDIPKTANSDTVEMLADALSDKPRGIVCKPAYLAWWRRADGTIEDEGKDDPTLGKGKAPSPPRAGKPQAPARAARAKKTTAAADEAGPRIRPLTERAAIEREIGRHAETVTLPTGDYPLVGCYRLQEMETLYAMHVSQRFAVAGLVTDTRPIPAKAAAILNAEMGLGASLFKIERAASGKRDDGTTNSVPVYPTVFAPKGEHGQRLLQCLRDRQPVTVVVRIVIAERNGLTGPDRWEGFLLFDIGKLKPKAWAFVVEEIYTDEISAAPAPARRKSSKRPPLVAPGGVQIE